MAPEKQQHFFVNGASQPRSKQISRTTWDEHKDSIIKWYLEGGTKFMMEQMLFNYDFSARYCSSTP